MGLLQKVAGQFRFAAGRGGKRDHVDFLRRKIGLAVDRQVLWSLGMKGTGLLGQIDVEKVAADAGLRPLPGNRRRQLGPAKRPAEKPRPLDARNGVDQQLFGGAGGWDSKCGS